MSVAAQSVALAASKVAQQRQQESPDFEQLVHTNIQGTKCDTYISTLVKFLQKSIPNVVSFFQMSCTKSLTSSQRGFW
jgi:hypothetical protein